MSMTCAVLSNRPLVTIDEWQRSLDALGFPLRLEPGPDRTIAALFGHLPALWKGHEAGFECQACGTDEADEIAGMYADKAAEVGGPWSCALAITYCGSAGCAGAMMAAVAYAHAVDGILCEDEEGVVYSGAALVPFARRSVEIMWEAMIRDGEAA